MAFFPPSGRTVSVVNGVSTILFPRPASTSNGSARYAALDRFVVGPENRLASIAAAAIGQGQLCYNPLVLTGPAGSGKTHLVQGLVASWTRNNPSAACVVTTAAEFAQQYGRARHDHEVDLLRSSYRTSKFTVLEDLTALAGRVTAQQELIQTLDWLMDAGSFILATCREPLARATWLLAGLRSRLMAGLEVPLARPELAARIAIIEELADARMTPITKTAVRDLAENVEGSVPELLGALTALEISRASPEALITPEDVASYLARRQLRAGVSLRDISKQAARQFGLTVAALKSPSRQRTVVLARSVAIYLARQASGKTLVQIGEFFGGRDHSTVLHSCRQIERLVHSDAETRLAVETLRASLGRPWLQAQEGPSS